MSHKGDKNGGRTEMTIIGMTGDEAVAHAAKQSKVDIVAAYPIKPQNLNFQPLMK
jgi:pyruvate/2-oxoacid:ferredoxin oxidoreductase alpha subunit